MARKPWKVTSGGHYPMKMLAVVTEDFAFYHDMVRKLRKSGISFVSMGIGELVPGVVGAVITTAREAPSVDFEHVFTVDYPGDGADAAIDEALDRAKARLMGKGRIGLLVIGIDPGKTPGIAVLGDAALLKVMQADSPEGVGPQVRTIIDTYIPDESLVRLGDGAPTQRDRIINSIHEATLDMDARPGLELVDEKNSSGAPHVAHTEAAMKIAMTQGRKGTEWRDVTPSDGELKELQRRSRISSQGEVTISRELAMLVAVGEMTLAEAVRLQREGTSQ